MTQGPATYQTQSSRSVAPSAPDGERLAQTNRIIHSPRIRSATVCPTEDFQVRTCKITGAGEVRHEHSASAAEEDYLDHLEPTSQGIGIRTKASCLTVTLTRTYTYAYALPPSPPGCTYAAAISMEAQALVLYCSAYACRSSPSIAMEFGSRLKTCQRSD
jgi:hypothetical protein